MRKEGLYSLSSPYREEMQIMGYRFGHGRKTACIIGSIRGNEVQQLYTCSQLIKKLSELEASGNIVSGNEIMVVPSVNHHSMNIGKRFWAVDNTDINRMFPGYHLGETTQRIAAGVFNQVKDYEYGIQFASFYMPGDFVPHVRMMDTGIKARVLPVCLVFLMLSSENQNQSIRQLSIITGRCGRPMHFPFIPMKRIVLMKNQPDRQYQPYCVS